MTTHHGRNPFSVESTRVLVTGASRGIGAAIATAFAEAGAHLALSARSREALEATAQRVFDLGHKAVLSPGEFSNPESAQEAVDDAAQELGGLDTVVHCAGVLPEAGITPFENITQDDWSHVLSVNLDASAVICRAAQKHLSHSPRGNIILMSSIAGLMATPGMETYAVTKAGQVSLTRTLAIAWARQGPRVNAICPGWVRTDMTSSVAEVEPVSDWLMAHVPQGEWLTPEDVAPTAIYLASPAASRVTGHTLVVDGGTTIADGGLAGVPKPASPFVTSEEGQER